MSEADLVARAQQVVGYSFQDPNLLITAFTHSSVADTRLASNERLEFFGDSVLGLSVCEELLHRFPEWLEGELTKAKSVIVSRRVCALMADEIGLTNLLILGNGINANAPLPMSLRAAVVESVLGAIFLDGGWEPARDFALRAASKHIDECAVAANRENQKSSLQQYVQQWIGATPQYEILDEQGPDHSKCFEVSVVIRGERFPSAWGSSKKEAEREAARHALDVLTQRLGEKPPG